MNRVVFVPAALALVLGLGLVTRWYTSRPPATLVTASLAPRSLAVRVTARRTLPIAVGIHKIRHVVVIMQENRSFDSYFGTFPGADGIPRGVCVPDPRGG